MIEVSSYTLQTTMRRKGHKHRKLPCKVVDADRTLQHSNKQYGLTCQRQSLRNTRAGYYSQDSSNHLFHFSTYLAEQGSGFAIV